MLRNIVKQAFGSKFNHGFSVNTAKTVGVRCFSDIVVDDVTDPNENIKEKCLNEVTLLGRVGATPQRRGSEESSVVTFSLATNVSYSQDGKTVYKPDWHNICIFKPKLQELVVSYITKGHRVLVKGRLIYSEIKDEEGRVRQTSRILADQVISFK
uniref:EOG090X0O5J n=1 Tax=Lynceus sp. MCZ IZ 141354 TaxID=1930659 RepID=A0A9N6WZM9_9CRUS|nr:EOG090X0O5J [Lynceus sp. MCZ IZ 141354]